MPLSAADKSEGLYLGPHATAALTTASPHSTAAPSPGGSSSLLPPPHHHHHPPSQHPPSQHPPPAPHSHPLPPLREQIDFEVETLFRALCPRNLVLVFLALLLECKVLLVSERLTLLTVAGEVGGWAGPSVGWLGIGDTTCIPTNMFTHTFTHTHERIQSLRLLLHPLKWCHLYVPLVPEVMVDRLIGCPTPFIMGLHRKTYLLRMDDFPADVVRVCPRRPNASGWVRPSGFSPPPPSPNQPKINPTQVDLDNDFVEVSAKDLNRKTLPFAGPLARRVERCINPSTALSDSFRWRVARAGNGGIGGGGLAGGGGSAQSTPTQAHHPPPPPHQQPQQHLPAAPPPPPFHSPTSVASHASAGSSLASPLTHAAGLIAAHAEQHYHPHHPHHPQHGPAAALRRGPDIRGALLVLRDFIQDLLMGVEDSCVFIRTEAEVIILFDETLFGHISGPSELLVTTPHDAETDLLPHSPHLPPAPPNEPQEGFVLRFSRTQAFSTALLQILDGASG